MKGFAPWPAMVSEKCFFIAFIFLQVFFPNNIRRTTSALSCCILFDKRQCWRCVVCVSVYLLFYYNMLRNSAVRSLPTPLSANIRCCFFGVCCYVPPLYLLLTVLLRMRWFSFVFIAWMVGVG